MPSPPHNPSTAEAHPLQPAPMEASEYSPEERALLLRLAHQAIESALEKRALSMDSPSSHLAEPRGVFTTLYLGGELRGCVGYVFPIATLYRAVAETARAAASQDTRFLPVSREEAPQLQISLSVLSLLQPIDPEQIEIGRHGLVVTLAGHRGLLLPQVPVEHRWDRLAFLEQTCRKAGLPAEAWKAGATLESFTAEVFGDPDLSS
jgi:AmmeMemoRadiSam system protein A